MTRRLQTIHLGHHFYGAGNIGDDFMLAGFLEALGPRRQEIRLTCCVPHPREPLVRRFPEVRWLPYETAARREAIRACDAWLGLGGSPFQCAAGRWFVDHLAEETRTCAEIARPMYFLGVGGQDAAAYALPEVRAALEQARMTWTRDADTAAAATAAVSHARIAAGDDLAHLWLAAHPPPPPVPGRLTAVLNFDHAEWPGLAATVAALRELGAGERIWLAHESRPLPGAERWLHERLPEEDRRAWAFVLADRPDGEEPGGLARCTRAWPSGEWLLTARFHAALAGAWAGSRIVILAINEKLRTAAQTLECPAINSADAPAKIIAAFRHSSPIRPELLHRARASAQRACDEFCRMALR